MACPEGRTFSKRPRRMLRQISANEHERRFFCGDFLGYTRGLGSASPFSRILPRASSRKPHDASLKRPPSAPGFRSPVLVRRLAHSVLKRARCSHSSMGAASARQPGGMEWSSFCAPTRGEWNGSGALLQLLSMPAQPAPNAPPFGCFSSGEAGVGQLFERAEHLGAPFRSPE